jgi:hypothetical protein
MTGHATMFSWLPDRSGAHFLGPMPIPLPFSRSSVEPLARCVLTRPHPSVLLVSGKTSSAGAPMAAGQGSGTPRLYEARPTRKRSGRAIEAGTEFMADGNLLPFVFS